MIGPHLGGERHAEILRSSRFRSKRELLRLLAEIDPKPEVPALVEPIGPAPAGHATHAAFVEALSGPIRELPPGRRPEDWIAEHDKDGAARRDDTRAGSAGAGEPPDEAEQQRHRGERCRETLGLEVHHRPAHALGGPATLIVPKPAPSAGDHAHAGAPHSCCPPPSCETIGSRYRPWAELLKRTFGIDVHTCPRCGGRMRLLALITEPMNVVRFLRHIGEPTEPPPRAPARDPPFWHSRVLRQRRDERSGQMGLFEEH